MAKYVEKLCINSFMKDGIPFASGCKYKVDFNPLNGKIYIYTVWGFTDITTEILQANFI